MGIPYVIQYKRFKIKLMNKHLRQHPLIPTIEGQFLSSNLIWTTAVQEIYNFCRQNSLPWLWYSSERWSLWFRAGCNKISILKTNMFVEAPLENLVTFIIVEQDEDSKVYEDMYCKLIKLIDILKDQQCKKNFKWIKGIEKNFKPIEEMLNEISVYKRRKTMPRTLKDHSHNTLFFN
ncbi:hypothetical protein Glove_79g125 [Diversispora epigaea]|uniref:Uncharacterized protein n=1 Tax=Diversispora epigaea TaxID=1348612 RepID=A0A397J8D0_9GLOM|nr:hypothetical protein Glove_79g125 [Diversispora epigaea]